MALFENVVASRRELCREYEKQNKEINNRKNRRQRKHNKLNATVTFPTP